jgi:arsenate reductase
MAFQVLFVCTHNSARSLLAEAMLNHWAQRLGVDLRAHSAGSSPSGRVNPFALQALANAGVSADGVHSKSWNAFCAPDAPPLDLVITVCDSAAGEACPHFPGAPLRVHWGYPDPSNAEGDDGKRRAFELTRQAIGFRLLQLLALPLNERAGLPEALRRIAAS